MSEGKYIVEFYQVGNSMKVSAIDTVTLKEVSIVGDPKMGQDHLSKLAIKKLEYVLAKS